jgi:hypothetical protein
VSCSQIGRRRRAAAFTTIFNVKVNLRRGSVLGYFLTIKFKIFSIAVVALSAAAIASGQQRGASRDPKTVVEQVIRKLDNERIQAQIHADAAALERIYADDFIGVGPSRTVRTKPQQEPNKETRQREEDEVRRRLRGR